jgi:hypothetical protein
MLMKMTGVCVALVASVCLAADMEPIRVTSDGRGFETAVSHQPFVPYGHNYGPRGELLEDYWATDWPEIAEDLRELKALGANVARMHLQLAKFMEAADRPNRESLERLRKLLRQAEEIGIYLDLTGLGCYRAKDVPAWYDELPDAKRWVVQARFWEAVAEVGAGSPAVFCYDLINEPIAPADKRKPKDWYSGQFGGYQWIQFIALDPAGRHREDIARDWVRQMTAGIRRKDKRHLITVGMLPSRMDWGHFSGFTPSKLAPELDFLCVHIYPEKGKVDEALTITKQFAVGKPLVIEETFPLTCGIDELREYMLRSRGIACGWVGHYFGKSLDELNALRDAKKIDISQEIARQWLVLFRELRPEMMERAKWPATQAASQPAATRPG